MLALRPSVWLLISTLLYFFPFVIGEFNYISPSGQRYAASYHGGTIFAVALALASIVFAILVFRDAEVDLSADRRPGGEAAAFIVFFAVFGIYTLMTPELFSYAKVEVLSAKNRFHYIFEDACQIGMVYAVLAGWRKNVIPLALSLIGLGLVLYIGHRSALAVAIAGIFYVAFRNRSLLSLKAWHVISALIALAFLVLYKSIYVFVKMGDIAAIKSRLLRDALWDNAVVGLEQFVTFAHLDFVVTYNYSLPCSNLWISPVALVPFMDEIINISACGYNRQIQEAYFSGYGGGVAANIWAEFFANLGYIGIPLVVAVILGACKIIEYWIGNCNSLLLKSGLILSIIEMTVYIQRKELMGGLVSAKRVVIVAILMYALARVLRPPVREWEARDSSLASGG